MSKSQRPTPRKPATKFPQLQKKMQKQQPKGKLRITRGSQRGR